MVDYGDRWRDAVWYNYTVHMLLFDGMSQKNEHRLQYDSGMSE